MPRFAVAGRSAATAATADNIGAALWNPAAAVSLKVKELHWFHSTATADNLEIIRISARGTASVTVTPDADNDLERLVGPASAAVLDVTYTVQPTVQGPPMFRNNLPAALGAGVIYVFEKPIEVPAGTGLAVGTPVAVALVAADVTFVWDE